MMVKIIILRRVLFLKNAFLLKKIVDNMRIFKIFISSVQEEFNKERIVIKDLIMQNKCCLFSMSNKSKIYRILCRINQI